MKNSDNIDFYIIKFGVVLFLSIFLWEIISTQTYPSIIGWIVTVILFKKIGYFDDLFKRYKNSKFYKKPIDCIEMEKWDDE